MAAYVDPNLEPEYFYGLLKPLAMLYDKVLIWSPVQSRLEDKGFGSADFLMACTERDPVIVPVGRETWFDRSKRRAHPDPECRVYDSSFETPLKLVALENGGVLSTDDFRKGYQVLDERWEDEVERTRIEGIVRPVQKHIPALFMARVRQVADERDRSLDWATANVFIQDIRAMSKLRKGFSLAPLVKMSQAPGYLVATGGSKPAASSLGGMVPTWAGSKPDRDLPHLPKDVKAGELVQFLEIAFSANSLSWQEIVKFRKSKRGKVLKWLNYHWDKRRQPLVVNMSEFAAAKANQLQKRVSPAMSDLSELVGTATLAYPGLHLLKETAARAVLSFLNLARLSTTLDHKIAKVLADGRDRFIVDTPFYQAAELRGNVARHHTGLG